MGTRKITRKEMKQDEFVSSVSRLTMWAEDHLSQILWGVAAVLGVILLAYAFFSWQHRKEVEGHAALASVLETYAAPVGSDPATPSDVTFLTDEDKFRTVIVLADGVLQNHGSTDAGQLARLYRGLARFELQEEDEARADLQGFLEANRSHYLAPQVRRKLAELDERAGNLDQACAAYQELSESASPVLPEELALLDLARCLAAKGEREQSVATYQRILDEFPQSLFLNEARTSLEQLQQG